MQGQLFGKDRLAYLLAGNATFTIVSKKTGMRFTYKVKAPRKDGKFLVDEPIRFVMVLCGPDNTADFQYFGLMRNGVFEHAQRKTRITVEAPSSLAFRWFAERVESDTLEFYHSGHCGRCGRLLSTPSSVSSGYGPECSSRMGLLATG